MPKAVKKTVKKAVEQKPPVEAGLTMPVYDVKGDLEKNLKLPSQIFGVKSNPKILAQYVRVYLINQRQGNASTKTRSEVIGSTRKIYRQKGTGKARHGDLKAPIFVGGGIVGGPKPKEYHATINKKVKKLVLAMALSDKEKDKAVFGLSDKFKSIEAKTKIIATFFKKIKCEGEKIVIMLPKMEKNNLVLAARNIPKVEISDVSSVNPYQLLNAGKIFFLEESLKIMSDKFKK